MEPYFHFSLVMAISVIGLALGVIAFSKSDEIAEIAFDHDHEIFDRLTITDLLTLPSGNTIDKTNATFTQVTEFNGNTTFNAGINLPGGSLGEVLTNLGGDMVGWGPVSMGTLSPAYSVEFTYNPASVNFQTGAFARIAEFNSGADNTVGSRNTLLFPIEVEVIDVRLGPKAIAGALTANWEYSFYVGNPIPAQVGATVTQNPPASQTTIDALNVVTPASVVTVPVNSMFAFHIDTNGEATGGNIMFGVLYFRGT